MEPGTEEAPERAAGGGIFATTHWSLVLHAGSAADTGAADALDQLCRVYWPAIHAYIRRCGRSPEDASDLTQAFFAKVLGKGLVGAADPARGRFRTFLLTLLKRFLADRHDHDTAAKRGGGAAVASLDELRGEEGRPEPAGGFLGPEEEFDRRWALATLDNAFRRLRAEAGVAGNAALFDALQEHLGGAEPTRTLEEIGAGFGLGEGATKMRLSRWRARYRELIRQEVAHTVPDLADLEEELRHLRAAVSS